MSDGTAGPPASTPPGWYPDATDPAQHRWWDGTAWTDLVQAVQPPPPPVPPPPRATQVPLTPPPPAWPDATATAVIPPTAAATAQYPGLQPAGARNPLALWALIVGIVGVLTVLIPFVGLVLGAVAIVLGVLGLARARETGVGRAQGIAGLVVGAVAAALGLTITVVMLVSFAVRGTADTGAEPVPAPSATVSESPEPDPEASEPGPAEPTEAAPPDAGAGDPGFVQNSRNDLVDVGKDLDDMIVTLDEGGFWRLLSNSVELSFNYGQLSARTAPATIAEEWAAQLAVLEGQLTKIDDAIADERNDDLRAAIAEAQTQLVVLNGVLDKAGE